MEEELREEEKPQQEIELKSPAVQEILGRSPRWIIRWGITVILIVVGGIVIGSCFFKYPDVVPATIEVTTENLPASLVARATGKLDTLFVFDNEAVEEDKYLAVIENTACFSDVLALKGTLTLIRGDLLTPHSSLFTNDYKLGELQNTYYSFAKAYEDYQYYIKPKFMFQIIISVIMDEFRICLN